MASGCNLETSNSYNHWKTKSQSTNNDWKTKYICTYLHWKAKYTWIDISFQTYGTGHIK